MRQSCLSFLKSLKTLPLISVRLRTSRSYSKKARWESLGFNFFYVNIFCDHEMLLPLYWIRINDLPVPIPKGKSTSTQ